MTAPDPKSPAPHRARPIAARVTEWFAATISRKLLVAFFLVFVATYLPTALVVQSAVGTAVTRAELDTLAQIAHLQINRLEGRFDQMATNLRAWSKLDVMNDLASEDVDKRIANALDGLKREYALSGDLHAFDGSGRLVASSDPSQQRTTLPAAWQPAGRLAFVDKHANPLGGGDVVALAVPVTSAFSANFPLGTLVLVVPWSEVRAALAERSLLVRRGAAPALLDATLAPVPPPETIGALQQDLPEGWLTVGGERYLANSAQAGGEILAGWQVVVLREPLSLAQTLDAVALKLAGLCALLAVPLTLAIRWLAQRLTAPLRELTRVVTGITETGDLSRRVPLLSRDETGALATAFNHMTERLEGAYHETVTMLSIACEGKDEDTGFHVNRVQHFTEALARELGLDEDAARHLGLMSILHDVGKLNIPDAILKKPGKLDAQEWAVMQTHSEHGVRILGESGFYSVAREIAISHHENWDGSGYPRGLAGEAIPLSGRIVKVADVFDALTSRRPYKEPWPVEQAVALLREQAGRQFDPRVVDAFLRIHAGGIVDGILDRFKN